MGKDQLRAVWSLGFVGGLGMVIALPPSAVWAQLVPDGSLGVERSVIQKINELSDRIDGGAARGANLFHSFQEFNVGQGRSVYFANPAQIQNILSRVTGGNVSNILGRLGVLGSANLFLINPNGIIFGPNSSLDIQGSFFATTADGIKLGDKGFFSATEPGKSDLLSVSPGALFFNQAASQAGNIINRGNLAVGGDLTLAAGNLDLQGQLLSGRNLTLQALDGVKIRDTVESPFMAAAVGDLWVQGNQSVDIFALNHPASGLVSGGNMVLRSGNTVGGDAHYWSGGSFRVEKLDGSLGDLYSPHDPVIRTGGDVFIGAYLGASLHIIAGGSVQIPGYILITGADSINGLEESITLSNEQQIQIDGKNKPTVDIRAGVSPEFIGVPSFVGSGNDLFFPPTPPPSSPTSANISVGTIVFSRNPSDINQKITGDVLLTNQYKPNLNLQGNITVTPSNPDFGFIPNFEFTAIDTASFADGGRVTMDSRGNINIAGVINSVAFEQLGRGGEISINGVGDVFISSLIDVVSSQGGNIQIKGNNINIITSTISGGIRPELGFKNAQSGNIQINADGNLNIQNSYIENSVYPNAIGNSGRVIIDAKNLNLSNNGSLVSNVYGTGNSGGVNIEAINLNLSNTGRIIANTLGKGDSGTIKIKTTENITINDDNSGIVNRVMLGGIGNSGGIVIAAPILSITNGGQIDASTFGQGNAGAIKITDSESIIVAGESRDGFNSSRISSSVQTSAVGNSGGIDIDTSTLSLTNGGLIFATSFGQGDGGKIKISAPEGITIDGESNNGFASSIRSEVSVTRSEDISLKGNSGGIEIDTSTLSLINGGLISAGTFRIGDSGIVKITAKDAINIEGQGKNTPVPSAILSQVEFSAEGNSGGIMINTPDLFITNGGQISASTVGKGNSGSVNIIATDGITINNQNASKFVTGILSKVESNSTGNSGGIIIDTGTFNIINGGFISASTNGQGSSGTVQIKATKSLTLDGEDGDALGSSILSQVQRYGMGNSGGIIIETPTLVLTNGGQVDATTIGQGNSGAIKIRESQSILIDGETSDGFNSSRISSSVQNSAVGDSGGIEIDTSTLSLTNGGLIFATSFGQGDAGKIKISASEGITIDGEKRDGFSSRIANEVSIASGSNLSASTQGNSGGIEINTSTLSLTNGGLISASTFRKGDSGIIKIKATDTIDIDGQGIKNPSPSAIISQVNSGAFGNSGGIEIETSDLFITNGAQLSASTFTNAQGNSGAIKILATGNLKIDAEDNNLDTTGIISGVNTNAIGNSGGILIDTSNLSILNGAQILASTSGNGNSGLVNIQAKDTVLVDGENPNTNSFSTIASEVQSSGIGNSGGIFITAKNLALTNAGGISSSTFGQGNAGIIQILTTGDIVIDGQGSNRFSSNISSSVQNTAIGNSEGIILNTSNLSLTNGGLILATSFGQGDTGKIKITATEGITIEGQNESRIVSEVNFAPGETINPEIEGNSEGIEIDTTNLSLINGGLISASTFRKGNAGAIEINAKGSITIDGQETNGIFTSRILSQVDINGVGNSGGIKINTGTISLLNGGEISASTFGKGNAGAVQINAIEGIKLDGENDNSVINSRILSVVGRDAEGNSEGITIDTNTLNLSNGGDISASTQGNGNAGNVRITATDKVVISDTYFNQTLNREIGGISAFTLTTGEAGDIIIKTPIFNISEGAGVEAFTQGAGNAGSITINSPQIVNIGQGSKITAETSGAGKAGDITITTDTLNIGKDAQLSATATQTATNPQGGGSITLNTSNLNISGKLGIFAETQGQSPAGNLTLQPINNNPNLNIHFTDNGFISASTTATGNGGNIAISAPQTVDIRGQGKIAVETSGSGNAGTIGITTQNLTLADGLEISASTTGQGNAGNINLNATNLSLSQTQINAFTDSTGNAGSISISNQGNNANQVSLSDNSTISTEIRANGQAHQPSNIDIRTNNLTLDNSRITASTAGKGDAGNITVPGGENITLKQSEITASTSGEGDTGVIDLKATGNLNLTNSQINSSVEQGAVGNSRQITLDTPNLSLNNSQINATTAGQGNAGSIIAPNANVITLDNSTISTAIAPTGQATQPSNITLNTQQLTLDNNSRITASTEGQGDAGSITVPNAQQITLNQSEITASTSGEGDTGVIDLKATGNLNLTNSQINSSVEQGAVGNSRQITLDTPNLSLNNSQINATTAGQGNAGSIIAPNANVITLDNSTISTAIAPTGQATQPSNITLNTQQLTLDNNSQITASTEGQGDAGSITVPNAQQITLNQSEITASTSGEGDTGVIDLKATGNLNLTNSQINSSVEQGAVGNSRQITLDTPNLSLNNSQINATTAGQGNAGSIIAPNANIITLDNSTISTAIAPTGQATQPSNITLNTQQLTLNNNSRITASTEGKGNAGNITVPNAQTISLDNNSQINASTSGEGNAGDIALKAQTVTLNNSSAITTTVNPNAIGRGGNITLQTTGNSLTLNNQSQISSRSQGQGNAGNILINSAGNVTLTNSDISTSAEQASGGAITITARNIRLNGDSNLRTNVASGAGGGGDITLTAGSILAFGDSDILAFARDGKGGNITFNTPIFFAEGFQPIPQDPNSLNGNNRVDINASGAVSGIITLPDLSFIPNSLIDLPENLIDTDNLIANSCVVPNRQKAGTFVITGSGGLPTRPGDASMSSYSTGTVRAVPDKPASSRSWQPGNPIIEPQGIYRLSNGQLVLSRECP